MKYIDKYTSPIGEILLAGDEGGVTGLWFEGQKYFANGLENAEYKPLHVFEPAKEWLDIYFAGKKPEFMPPLHFIGTEYQQNVWRKLCEIPYGEFAAYGDIAKSLNSSPRAVGSAVGHNKISLMVPCHRVVGADRSLTGYAGGIWRKEYLIKLEGIKL